MTLPGDLKKALREELRRPSRYFPKEQSVSITFTAGTPAGTEGLVEVAPPAGYLFAIRYFKLTTPPEVRANVLLTGLDGFETKMLAEDQDENLADQLYDASDWEDQCFYLQRVRLYAVTKAVTTADRSCVLKWSGGLVR